MSSPRALAAPDPWAALRRHTPARIALGRAGCSLPTAEVLAFGLAHARARDAVRAALDAPALVAALREAGHEATVVRSAAPDRATFLARPDLGRRLDPADRASLGPAAPGGVDIALVAADGLSALAAQRHLLPLLEALRARRPTRWRALPVTIALQARVALGDVIGERLGARVVVIAIGERPGLSAPVSLGLYLTANPGPGRTDAERNCISNVRPGGLSASDAAWKLDWLTGEALRRGLSGISLPDESGSPPPALEP